MDVRKEVCSPADRDAAADDLVSADRIERIATDFIKDPDPCVPERASL
jgi:hypothetical protein